MSLLDYGWDDRWRDAFARCVVDGAAPARIGAEHQHIYRVYLDEGEALAKPAGRIRHEAAARADFPVVGDWVAVEVRDNGRAVIREVLPRRSSFSRKAAGEETIEQVVAANVDAVFLVSGLDNDFNVRRIERYLIVASESGAAPVIVLNKADLCTDLDSRIAEVQAVAPSVPVHVVSCRDERGVDVLREHLGPGRTGALLGSSGVGKSTIINRLMGRDVQRTGDVRDSDDRGRHTTSHRELVLLDGGGLLIDTPGMRELQLWMGDEGLRAVFDDIEALAAGCRFDDCAHDREPQCAVRLAVAEGRLDAERLEGYHKLRRELAHTVQQQDVRARLEDKGRIKAIHREQRRFYKRNPKQK